MTKERKDTRIHLVAELEKLPESGHSLVQEIIKEAKAGEYHDYKNQKYVCGKVAVSAKLRYAAHFLTSPQLLKIAQDIEQGVYDEQADEEDRADLHKTIRMMANNITRKK